MRRALLPVLVAVGLSLLAAGCGAAGSSTTGSPLGTELSYVPSGTLLAATIATNPQGTAAQNLNGLLGAIPFAKIAIVGVEQNLASQGVNYQREIEPLYGNPIVFAVLRVSTGSPLSGSNFVAAWITKSKARLDALIKSLPHVTAIGSADGAALYRAGSMAAAVDGATLVLGSSPAQVKAALDRHARGGGMTAADFSKAMGNLPRNALVQAVGTLSSVLGSPGAGSARSIPWVGAIRGYAASLSATSTGLSLQFRLDTSGGSLTAADLPIATATGPPELAGTLPIAVGVRDPAQTIAFAEAIEKSVAPAAYARFVVREKATRRKTGYDLNTFASLLTGSLIVESDSHTTMGRAGVSDPASAARQLAKLPRVVRDLVPTAKVTRQPGGFYLVKNAAGRPLELGLVGNEFVLGVATPAQLRGFARAPATPAPNAQGPVAVRISLLALLHFAVGNAAPNSTLGLAGSFLSTLGSVTGSASATRDALTGDLELRLK
ncbi:MAG TPA: DUF3352 domain-containing protein [Solirubrobacteraceae bacterium]|nr:DUF3352 domain-containing protein [Solirubrobacteraceae bacterium]